MNPDTVIQVRNLSKSYKKLDNSKANIRSAIQRTFRPGGSPVVEALKDVTFDVKRGEIFGIIGHNGSGKTTLLNCLIGALEPDEGSVIETKGRLLKLSLGMGFDPNLSGRENIYVNGSVIGLTFKQIGECFEEIVEFSGLREFIDSPVKTYSRGMKSRLMFSIAIFAKADVFLFDEFFGGVGDQDFKKKSAQIFEKKFLDGRTVVLVSHSMNQIKKYCDRVLWLERGEVTMIGEAGEVVAASKEGSKVLSQWVMM